MNIKHPEQQEGEIFLFNEIWPPKLGTDWKVTFVCLPWKTKRLGNVAYTMDGKAMPQQWNLRPVFVQASELLDHHPLEKWFGGILSQLEDALDANEEKGTVNRAVK